MAIDKNRVLHTYDDGRNRWTKSMEVKLFQSFTGKTSCGAKRDKTAENGVMCLEASRCECKSRPEWRSWWQRLGIVTNLDSGSRYSTRKQFGSNVVRVVEVHVVAPQNFVRLHGRLGPSFCGQTSFCGRKQGQEELRIFNAGNNQVPGSLERR